MTEKNFSMTEDAGFFGDKIVFKTNLLKSTSYDLYYRKLYCHEQLKWAKRLVVYFITTDDWMTRIDHPYSFVDCAVAKFRKQFNVTVFKIRAFREAVTVAFLAGRDARRGLSVVESKEIRKNPNFHTYKFDLGEDDLYKRGCAELEKYIEQSLVSEAERLPYISSPQEIEACIILACEYGKSLCAGCTSGLEEEDKVISGVRVTHFGSDEFIPGDWYERLKPSKELIRKDDKARLKNEALEWFSSLTDDRKEQLLILACEVNRRVNYEKDDCLREKYSGAFKRERFIWEVGKVISEFSKGHVPVSAMGKANPLPKEIKDKAKETFEMLIFAVIVAIILGSCLKVASKPPYGDRDPPEDWPYNF